eukprot:TRINITY_DN2323_c0_g1_i3.p1 TRINITY_DN2323_c0_g1~~TRINITY_DN2323_c0_g1_i3.p1  ORF type:complete len:565 (-),score=100.23 TRINITY_DN2323_c0_g1_i3:220-1914(-)
MGDSSELDDLLASFGASTDTVTVDYGGVGGNESFDFLDSFLEEMGEASGSRPALVDEPIDAALEEIMLDITSPVSDRAMNAVLMEQEEQEGWSEVVVNEKAASTSLDSSKDIRAMKREINKANAEAKRKNTAAARAAKKEDDGFVPVQVEERATVSLDSPSAIEELERELMREFSGAAPAKSASDPRKMERPLTKPPLPKAGKSKRVQTEQPRSFPVPQVQQVPKPVQLSVPMPTANHSDSVDLDALDALLDEISPATIRRIPAEEKPRASAIFQDHQPAPPVAESSASRLDAMDKLMGELDLNITAPRASVVAQAPRPAVQIRSLDDLDALESVLGASDSQPAMSQAPSIAAPVIMDESSIQYARPAAEDKPVSYRYSMQLAPMAAPKIFPQAEPDPFAPRAQNNPRASVRSALDVHQANAPVTALSNEHRMSMKPQRIQSVDPVTISQSDIKERLASMLAGDRKTLFVSHELEPPPVHIQSEVASKPPEPEPGKPADYNYASGWGKLQGLGEAPVAVPAVDLADILNAIDPKFLQEKQEAEKRAEEAAAKKRIGSDRFAGRP